MKRPTFGRVLSAALWQTAWSMLWGPSNAEIKDYVEHRKAKRRKSKAKDAAWEARRAR